MPGTLVRLEPRKLGLALFSTEYFNHNSIYCLNFLITEYMFEISSSYELLVDKVTSALTQSQSLEPLLYAFD